jgi:molybdopterin-dependent oxidoreductase alpha subunit
MSRRVRSGGGWRAIWYTLRKARAVGARRMWRAMRSKNACKTCALGMGGQLGGMVNEKGRFPEVCKKSVQAMAADMQGPIHERFFDDVSLEQLQALTSRELEAAGRLTRPLYAGPLDSHYTTISWDEAIDRIARKLQRTDPNAAFFYFSGRSSNEAGFLMQVFARLWGTNNINNCSYYCHQASGVGLSSVTGSGTATITLEDLDLLGRNDVLLLIGANPASNHPRFMRTLVDLKRRGAKVIVINPLREIGLVRFRVPSDPRSLLFGSTIADEYVQPHIGGDIALLSGMAMRILERGAVDQRFVSQHADGWDEVRRHIESLRWDDITHLSGVERAQIERIADIYAAAPKAIFCWAMGITHHEHGVGNVQMIANLAIMRGMLGAPGRGLLPLRGHSNVQGIGSMGVAPKLKQAIFDKLEKEFSVALPTTEGWDTLTCLNKAHGGHVRFASCLGGNLYGSNPDAHYMHEAFSRIDMTMYMNTTLNTGHAWGRGRETIILPVLARDEEPQATTQESMFNYVRLSEGGEARHAGPRSEVDVIASIAHAVLGDRPNGPIQWHDMKDHVQLRQMIARIIPGYERLAEIDAQKKEFTISGRVFHEPSFPTDTGRAKMHVIAIPSPAGGNGEPGVLRLMTMRSEGQFNTVVYEDEDLYRGQERRDVILMNAGDIKRLGLHIDERIIVKSATGEMHNVLVREGELRSGNCAMYYPEANALVPRVADPQSRTPAFKSVAVRVVKQGHAPQTSDSGASRETMLQDFIAAGSSRDRMNRC